jgi:hypothetical protein
MILFISLRRTSELSRALRRRAGSFEQKNPLDPSKKHTVSRL